MFVVKNRNIFFAIIGIAVILSFFSVIFWGLHFGIDYTGGSAMEVNYSVIQNASSTTPSIGRPDQVVLEKNLGDLGLGAFTLQPTGDSGYILKTRYVTEAERTKILDTFSMNGATKVEEKSFTSVGPVIGNELKQKALVAIVLVILCIVAFITFAFRKVSEPVASWKYGIIVIITLVHDIIIPFGVFGILVHFYGAEIDILFTTALLAILGISISDTIVVFDRIRENLRLNREGKGKKEFDVIVGESLKQTYVRSFNTSFTVILVLLALFFFGGDTTKTFSLVLLFGMFAGTYSSIFLASPLLVVMNNMQQRKAAMTLAKKK